MDPTIITPDSVTVNATGDSYTVTKSEGDGTTITLPEGGATATEGTDYIFTAALEANYKDLKVTYKVKGGDGNYGEAQPLTETDGSYTIPGAQIKGDIEIGATATKITYNVSASYTADDVTFTCDALESGTTAGTIDAGEDLAFTATIKDADNKEITAVSYTIGGTATQLDVVDNGAYTISAEKITGDITITVTSAAIPTYDITFATHANVAKVTDIKVNNVAAGTPELSGEADWKINAKKGSTVSFKLVADEKFQVTKVTDGDQNAVTPVAGVYTIENLSANVALDIATGLTTDANGFSFALETGSDRQSATMTVEAFTSDADIAKGLATVAGVYNAGESALTLNEKIVVSFTAKEGYELGDVKVGGVKVEGPTTPADTENGTPAKYEVTLEAGKSKAITVATDAKGSEAEKSFAITNSAAHMTLDAVEADGTAITPAEGKYLAASGKKRITFSVTADGAYEPVVTAVTNAAEEGGQPTKKEIEAEEVKTASGKTTYKYLVLASQLADEYTITEIQAVKTISFTGGDNTDVSIDGKLVDDSKEQKYVQGRKLTVKVAAKENAVLNSVSYTIGDANEVKPKVTKNVAEFTLTLTDDTEVTINATGALVALPLEDAKGALPLVKGAYNVSYDGVYTAAIGEGVKESLVDPTDAKLFNGNAEVAAAEGKNAIVSIKNKKAEVDLRNADVTAVSGKKLTLKVTVGTGEDAKTFAYTLQVSKAIAVASDITVPAKANQPTDTEKTYAVSTKGEISRLQARVEEAAITAGYIAKQPEINKDGKLVITTGQTVTPAEGVKVTVYTGTGDNEISKDVLVKTTALISNTTAAPKVTLKSATDISMTLSMSAKTDADVAIGGVYYKVTATAAGTVPAGLEQTVTKYVAKTGDAQDYKLNVASVGTALGQGSACSYKVTVSLVHAKDKNTALTADNEDVQKVAESEAFTTADSKPFATQNPAWEANLKLKKGTTTIYTGQTGVSIATPQFTKTTTYTEITKDDIKDCTQTDGNGLKFEVENGVIKASASALTTVGKHTVQVVALADNAVGGHSMVASKATIVVTVAKGINTLGVSVPATSMYKAVNKAATLKATPVYNGDTSGKDKRYQPKTKRVKWELVKAAQSHAIETDEVFGGGKVTIKNGTVTVAKDYVIKADPDENKFQIRVMVDNEKTTIGDAKAAYSAPIEITNEGLDMDRLVIVGSDDKVLAISNESKAKTETKVAASDLDSATVKILTAGADVQTVGQAYVNNTANTELSYTDMTYKSSKAKDVGFSTENGNLTLTVAKANTKPVLTVTANDGSKATLGIKLNVDYDTPAGDLALWITDAQSKDIYNPTNDGTTVSKTYAGSATNMLFAELMQNKDGRWINAEDYVNYDIKVTGGKKVAQEGATALITTDKAEVKIELTNKSKTPAAKMTYTLTNSKFVASGAKVKAKVIGSLRQVAKPGEQDVKLELDIPAECAAGLSGDGKTAAVEVGVDWAKANLKNGEDLVTFEDSLEQTVYDIELKDFNATTKKAIVKLAFDSDNAVESYNQKSYALKVSVGSKTGDNFEHKAPAVAATLKVEKTKKFTFKPTTSYTIATRDGGAVITGKASVPDYELEDLGLLNANFGGQANEFTKYFKISNGKLMINNGITAADISNLLSNKDYKNHLTGYLTYNATTDKSYYELSNGTGRNTVKITVKLNDTKAVAKYTAEAAEIMNKADAATDVQILANKAPVTIMHAKFDTTKTDAAIASDAAAETALVSNGKIRLSLKETTTKSSIKATVYVVPVDSYYESEFAEGKTPTLDTYKNYGTAVTITLKVKQPTTMTLEQAKAAVTAWVEEVKADTDTPGWLTGDESAVKSAIITEAGKAIVADNAADFTVAYKKTEGETPADDFTFNGASESADGTVSGTLLITLGDASEEVEFAFTIPQKQTTPPAEATVEKVEIKKDGTVVTTDTVQAGSAAVTYTAEVTGTNLTAGTDDQVTWELENYSGSTSTLQNGVLTVGAGETANTTLTVKATSQKDPTKSATVTVTVTAAETGGGD